MPFSKGFTEQMRKRTMALFDAYFAQDQAPLRRLRDEFQVTHLVFETTHFPSHHRQKAPKYFRPFDRAILARTRGVRAERYELLRLVDQASFRSGSTVVLDLSLL